MLKTDPVPRSPVVCYVGLGSNLGDRAAAIQQACALLDATPGLHLDALSPLYESPPWGFLDQPSFLNAVARVSASLGPVQTFLALQRIEQALGRIRRFRWGPREIDLDLLLYGDLCLQRRGLTIPHPAMTERAFVLVPLSDLWPTGRLPDGRLVADARAALEPHDLRRVTRLFVDNA